MPSNSIGDALERFTTNLDRVVMQETRTADLNMNQNLLGEYSGHGRIEIPSIDMDGLADHTRGGGFTRGGLKLTFQPYTLAYERDREFSIDVMDDEERELILSANAMAEFARTKVVPEVDAVRFAKLAANAGNSATADLTTADAALNAVLVAEEVMQDMGKELNQCLIYHTAHVKTLLREAQNYRLGQGEAPNGTFSTFDEMKMVGVPQDRFYTAIDLLDGTTEGEEDGGYNKASAGKNVNFIVMAPEAAAAITKHEKLRYFDPDTNQDDDAHLWQYRLYHDLLVYLKKNGLIYLHYATA